MKLYAALQASAQRDPGAPASQLGRVIGLSGDAQDAFALALAQGGTRSEILARLKDGKVLTPAQITDVQTTLTVHDVVLGDLALVKALKPGIADPTSVAKLAKLLPDEWVATLSKAGAAAPDYAAGSTPAQQLQSYAQLLSMRATLAYPSAAFAGGLARAPKPPLDQAPRIVEFIDSHPDFEFKNTSIDGYLKTKAKTKFANAAGDTAFVRQMKAAQRIVKIAPNHDAAVSLLADNVHSAGQIYRIGKTQFVGRYQNKAGFDAASAEQTFNAAANTWAAVLTIVGELRATQHANQVQGLANPVPALDDLPDWSDLFGHGDLCECEDCRSIFSPAAYLADLLKWLEARQLEGTTQSAKDVLFERRPDIGYIELSCDNSNTELPYIDLACELMEEQVAPSTLFALGLATNFVAGPINADVKKAFHDATPSVALSDASVVFGPDHFKSWIVRDGDVSYLVANGAANYAVSILRQTHGDSDDLMAYPQYVNTKAYQSLRDAQHPLTLPFDLNTESLRGYLGLANLTRADTMRLFRGKDGSNPSDFDIAADYLAIGWYESKLIFSADTANQNLYWNYPDNPTTLAQMSKVDVFLDRTGLDFNGLQKLLSLQFVNPGGVIVINNLDDSCDTDKKTLQVLDLNALDRIHRFLRLWRKLGWEMWEVDLAIQNAGLGQGLLDSNLALHLGAFVRLKNRLAVYSVEQLCAWFDNISTAAKFTAAYHKPLPSLYERLFLNTRTSGPIDPDFAIALVSGATTKVIDDHQPRILAAGKLKAADLAIVRALTKPGTNVKYIDDKLTLGNLSFVYRHALFARALGIKIADWQTLLALLQTDPLASVQAALDFTELCDRLKNSGFGVDAMSYLLTANTAAKAAVPAKTIATALGALQKGLQAIAAANDVSQLPTDAAAIADAIAAKLQQLGWDAGPAANAVAVLTNTITLSSIGPAVAAITFPVDAPATYDAATKKIYFTGVMSDAQLASLLANSLPAAVRGDADFIAAVNELHDLPRRLVKFYLPQFSAPLAALPAAIQFSSLDKALATRIDYDGDKRTLNFFGIMTRADKAALTALSGDAAYLAALQVLFQAPASNAYPAAQLWLGPGELANNLPTAANRLVAYLAHKLSTDLTVQQLSTALGLTQASIANLLNGFALFGPGPNHRTIMAELLDPAYVASGAAITADAFPGLFVDFYWLHRVALILKTVGADDSDLLWIEDQPATKAIFDLAALPLAAAGTTATSPAQFRALLGLAEFMQWHHQWSDGKLSLLDVVHRLVADAGYTSELFGADVEALAGWTAADVKALADGLDIAYPASYRTSDGWRRLNQCFTVLQAVTGNAPALLALSATQSSPAQDESLRSMLRAQYSETDWLASNKTIQDKLRERKRDSLAAYLFAQGAPANAPNSPWTDLNDLFDYFLIDTQMCSCMPTTRIVQAYAAVQLFVQRCLMGLEPKARASAADDQGWAQWEFMKFYRLRQAALEVYTTPENYCEPELRKDKSELFQNLENAILQNGVTKDNVESAFLAYLEGLDDIAQLDVAGTFYQEDIQTLHVFGRTAGGDPRLYYYRQFIAGRRWTPWSKIDIDIKGDYLTPFVLHGRLYAVWLEFQSSNDSTQTAHVPSSSPAPVDISNDSGAKRMNVYLAISELRNGKWTTKKLADSPFESQSYTGTYDDSGFLVVPLDLTWLPSTLFPGGVPQVALPTEDQWLVEGTFLIQVNDRNTERSQLFAMAGCRGYPEDFEGNLHVYPVITTFQNTKLRYARDVAYRSTPDLTPNAGTLLPPVQILANKPSVYKVLYPHYLSLFDRMLFLFDLLLWLSNHPLLAAQQGAMERVRAAAAARDDYVRVYALLGSFYDWFYADSKRTFHIRPELLLLKENLPLYYEDIVDLFKKAQTLVQPGQWPLFVELLLAVLFSDLGYRLKFGTFYHPLTCKFLSALYSDGITGLMSRQTQFADGGLNFGAVYQPAWIVDKGYPDETAVFDDPMSRYAHGYASYNWELFYFAPVMVAERLSQNQQFDDAMRWYHYIFDPTGGHDRDPLTNALATAPQKYWITKPFYQRQSATYLQQRIENIMQLLANDPANPTDPALLLQLQDQVKDWRNDPFDPHLIAQYRTVAYQKFVVMKYLDNLIAWGDQQFTMDTMESVNIATQLYVLAAHILGKRPEVVPPAAKPQPETFNELDDKLDALSNAIVQFENLVPPMGGGGGSMPAADLPGMLYFCIPQNDKLLGYWNTVEDRLYKIRHCLNIEGVFSPPVLFPPPINPLDLIKAAAAGIDLSTALADLSAPLPYYRFASMLQMANEVAGDIKALGGALLAALEKKDAETLSLLRQGHEIAVLQAARNVKQKQIEDAQIALEGLKKNQELVTQRRDYYAGREFMNAGETAAMALAGASLAIDAAIAVGYALSGGLKLVPEFMIGAAGFGGSPTANASTGGQSFGNSAEDAVKTISSIATALDKAGSVASVVAGYQRRMDDWQFQMRSASKELEQIALQIAGAEKKIEIAETELANQDLQIANSKAVNSFMQNKYTNQELYQWMVGQISQTYFQSYNLACSIAKNAEKCFRYELGIEETSYVQPTYWNSLRSGLQAGEGLQLDLRRMENDYRNLNRREFECVKHVSLLQVNPQALLDLKGTGLCNFDLPEELFDLDYPGHYFRRIKSVAISIPCVAGPYAGVNATLRLLKNSIRINTGGATYAHHNDDGVPTDDDRFRSNNVRVTAIAASSAQNDSGVFELSFRDERYLPFEGAGAISSWQIEMMTEPSLRTFDYATISDVILHIRYTAREDAGNFRSQALAHLKDVIAQSGAPLPQWRAFDLMREFPNEWYAMLHPAGGGGQILRLPITKRHFPLLAQGKFLHMQSATIIVNNRIQLKVSIDPPFDATGAGGTRITINAPAAGHVYAHGTVDKQDVTLDETQVWQLSFLASGTLTAGDIAECYLVIGYDLEDS
jgi:hypothetical protein